MDDHAAKLIGAGLAMTGLIGAGAGLGILFGNYLQAAMRNPSAAASERPMLFILVPIELVSFLVRPVTLSMRLFGNMIGGHVVMYMFASFVVGMGVFALGGGLAYLGFIGSALSLFMVIALFALELIVAFLQAFVFAALTCTYLSDVVNLDHGH